MRRIGRPTGFVCRGWLLAVLGACTPAAAATLTRGPYLQLLTTHSVTVVWNTDVPAACGLEIHARGAEPSVLSGATGTACAITADGLATGGLYRYKPLADGSALMDESLFRVDDPRRPFSFAVIGDSGTGGPDQLAIRDRIMAAAPDFVLHTGDMVYDAGATADFDLKFFTPYRDLLRRVVLWPALGNHDVRTASGAPWMEAFYTPANNAHGTERYYSFDAGNAHVVVLDSNASSGPGSPQYTFVDDDLAASHATWKFVAFHHPLYSSGEHGSTLTLRASLQPLIDRHAVDIVFNGHDHSYERTLPLRGDVPVAPGEGTVYVVTGGGGQTIRPVGTSPFTAYAEATLHFTRVAIDGGTLHLEMVRGDGSVGDELTLVKATATTTTTTTTSTTALESTTTTIVPPCPLLAGFGDGATCDGALIPRRIILRIERARPLMPARGDARIHRRLERIFERIDHAIGRAEARGEISSGCADQLSSAEAGCL